MRKTLVRLWPLAVTVNVDRSGVSSGEWLVISSSRLPGRGATPLANFTVGGQPGTSTLSLTTVLLDGDNLADLVVGSGAGQTALIKVYYGTDVKAGPEPTNFTLAPFDGVALNGVFVG